MTGRYEEPETRQFGPAGPGNREAAESEAGPGPASGTAQPEEPHGEPDYGNGAGAEVPYVDPRTNPATMNPVPPRTPGAAPGSGRADPAPSGSQPPQMPPPEQQGPPQQPFHTDPVPSGPHRAPSNPPTPSGGYPVQSGPHPVPGGPSGPYPVAGDSSMPYYAGGQPYAGHVPPGQPPQGGQSPYQQHPFPAPHHAPGAGAGQDQHFGQDLSSAQLLRQTKRPPQSGWRRAVYVASGRTINLGESPADVRRRELIARINQPLQGCYKIAMLSLKGGVGKTTATATLGSTFASLRGDRVIAVDANPDRGTLSQKIPLETTATVRHLLRDAQRIRKYSDVRSYTSQGPSRLEILASEQDPAVSEAFSEADYRRSVTLLEHFYNVVLTDCGTGLMHSAMKGVLDVADSLVIVSSSSIDGARSASATLDWLDAHGYGELVGRSVAVINSVRPGSGKVDVDKLAAHFDSRCRAVSKIPFDPHLEEGAEVELDQLAAPTRMALLELAATVADDFPHALGRQDPRDA